MVWEGQPHRAAAPHNAPNGPKFVCPVDNKPREARTRARGKKERVQGEGLGRVMHTRGACVLLREWRLAGGESRQGSAERMQCSFGKRPLDAETITWVGWRLRGDSVCECAARQT